MLLPDIFEDKELTKKLIQESLKLRDEQKKEHAELKDVKKHQPLLEGYL